MPTEVGDYFRGLAEEDSLIRRTLEIFPRFTRDTWHQHPHSMGAINNFGNLLMEMGDTQAQAEEKTRAVMAPFGMSI